jgi:hypothetical protein
VLRVVVALAAAVAGACAPTKPPSSGVLPDPRGSATYVVTADRGALGYSGEITAEGLRDLIELDDGSATTLMIRSPGGDVRAGMIFGDWVDARGLDVVVVDYCVSSCANYVFMAGKRKLVLPGGVVAWHGDAHQRDLGVEIERLGAEPRAVLHADLDLVRAKEDRFFARLGVVECVCRIGNERLGARGLYTMSPADMARFGVKNIVHAPASAAEISEPSRLAFGLAFVSIPSDFDPASGCR